MGVNIINVLEMAADFLKAQLNEKAMGQSSKLPVSTPPISYN